MIKKIIHTSTCVFLFTCFINAQETNPLYLDNNGDLNSSIYIQSTGSVSNSPSMFFHLPYVGTTGNSLFEFDGDDSGTRRTIFRLKTSGHNIFEMRGWSDGTQSDLWFGDENNDKFFISENGNVGIGTTSPDAKMHISSGSEGIASNYSDLIVEERDAQIDIISSSDATWGSSINLIEGNGSSNTDIWSIARQTTNGDGNSSLRFNFGSTNQHNNTNKVTFDSDGNVGIGTDSPDQKLTVKGKIHSEEIIVDLNVPGPDYVFEPDYDLTTLAELEAFIQANKHLPEIPSAATMEEEGIILGEMNMLLLKKIEELTLHTIEQQKLIEEMTSSMINQEKRIQQLEESQQ